MSGRKGMREAKKYDYSIETVAEACYVSDQTIRNDVKKKLILMDDLGSVATYIRWRMLSRGMISTSKVMKNVKLNADGTPRKKRAKIAVKKA